MDAGFFDSQSLLFESNEFDFENFLSDFSSDQSPGSSPSSLATNEEYVFDSPPHSSAYQNDISAVQNAYMNDVIPSKTETFHSNMFPDTKFLNPGFASATFPEALDDNSVFSVVKPEPFAQPVYSPVVVPQNPIVSRAPVSPEADSSSEKEPQRGTKRSRKRRKLSPQPSSAGSKKSPTVINDRNSIILTREELLSFSSEQYEEFVSQVTDVRELTTNEKGDLKRQRRLIKNRESAQASRQRKKSHIDELERRVKELTSENGLLKENFINLSAENVQLKNEVAFLQSVVNKTGMSNLLSRGATFLSSLGKQNQLPPNNVSAGIVLMVMLFSFGLFFNNLSTVSQKPIFPAGEPVPEVAPRVFNLDKFEATSQSKDLLSTLSEQEIPVQRLENAYKRHLARDTNPIDEIAQQFATNQIVNLQPEQVNQQVNPQQEQSHETLTSHPQLFHWKPNTTYLLCENVKQILPPEHIANLLKQKGTKELESTPAISFLIPPDTFECASQTEKQNQPLNAADDRCSTSYPPLYLEVTCQVLNVDYITSNSTVSLAPDVAVR